VGLCGIDRGIPVRQMAQTGSSLLRRTQSRAWLRKGLHRIGGLGLWRSFRVSDKLTVLVLHRIVPESQSDVEEANPHDSLTLGLFESSLAILSRHYSVIGLAELLAWIDGGPALPVRPLLITFDDGWADTARHALPALRCAGLPAVLFVATDAVADDGPVWWQDAALREGAPESGGLLDRLCALSPDVPVREALLARSAAPARPQCRQMLRPEELGPLPRSGMAIGAHSAAHLPLTRLSDPEIADDLARSRRALSGWLSEADARAALRCLAFPHGRWDGRVLALARSAGFDVFFSSDPCLNSLIRGPFSLFGRIPLNTAAIAGPDGRLAPDRLATWLLARPTRMPEAGPP
jgi:peptidoglycan/xylan/chitin deacetylase (PgdA/CDA1 family)